MGSLQDTTRTLFSSFVAFIVSTSSLRQYSNNLVAPTTTIFATISSSCNLLRIARVTFNGKPHSLLSSAKVRGPVPVSYTHLTLPTI